MKWFRVGALVPVLLASACGGDAVDLPPTPVTIGPIPQLFGPPSGLPASGPRNELTLWLPAGYTEDRQASRNIIYDANHQPATIRVASRAWSCLLMRRCPCD